METYNHLYASICSFENLLAAARLAQRGKRFQHAVGRFNTNLDREVLALRDELLAGTYRPGGYHEKIITRPKTRMISAAPYRDRVVHHAVCRVVMPLFERKMIFDLYSNRAGKGTHAAIQRCQHYSRRYSYVLKCDVRKFFPSMDHGVLKAMMRRTIRCRATLWLLDRIIDGSNAQEPVNAVFGGDDLAEAGTRRVGLPIGNLTSQWFGCIYLTEFDHWVKETLRCPGYIRYVDDFLLFGDDKAQLAEWRERVGARLADYRLRLNERKSRTYRTVDGVTFLGQRVWPGRRRIVTANARAAQRRLRWNVKQFQRREISQQALEQRWMSWRGHALQADSTALIERTRAQLVAALRRDRIPDRRLLRGGTWNNNATNARVADRNNNTPSNTNNNQGFRCVRGIHRHGARPWRRVERTHPRMRSAVPHESPPALACFAGVGRNEEVQREEAGSFWM